MFLTHGQHGHPAAPVRDSADHARQSAPQQFTHHQTDVRPAGDSIATMTNPSDSDRVENRTELMIRVPQILQAFGVQSPDTSPTSSASAEGTPRGHAAPPSATDSAAPMASQHQRHVSTILSIGWRFQIFVRNAHCTFSPLPSAAATDSVLAQRRPQQSPTPLIRVRRQKQFSSSFLPS